RLSDGERAYAPHVVGKTPGEAAVLADDLVMVRGHDERDPARRARPPSSLRSVDGTGTARAARPRRVAGPASAPRVDATGCRGNGRRRRRGSGVTGRARAAVPDMAPVRAARAPRRSDRDTRAHRRARG